MRPPVEPAGPRSAHVTGVGGGEVLAATYDDLEQLATTYAHAGLRLLGWAELPASTLVGEMSVVGPRPVTPQELSLYGENAQIYLACTPGITGLWQVSGRNNLPYRRRVALDRLYARSKCLSVDLKILLLTVPAVLSRNGSY